MISSNTAIEVDSGIKEYNNLNSLTSCGTQVEGYWSNC